LFAPELRVQFVRRRRLHFAGGVAGFAVERFVYNVRMPLRAPQGNPKAVKHSRTPPPEDTFEEPAYLKALGEKQKPFR